MVTVGMGSAVSEGVDRGRDELRANDGPDPTGNLNKRTRELEFEPGPYC
jgi:hypothetical protein